MCSFISACFEGWRAKQPFVKFGVYCTAMILLNVFLDILVIYVILVKWFGISQKTSNKKIKIALPENSFLDVLVIKQFYINSFHLLLFHLIICFVEHNPAHITLLSHHVCVDILFYGFWPLWFSWRQRIRLENLPSKAELNSKNLFCVGK